MRADQLVKRRQQEHEQIEAKKKKIEEENRMQAIDEKFKAHYDAVEQMLKTDTVGLVSLDEMKKKQEDIVHAREQQLAREKESKLNEAIKNKQGQLKDASGHHRPNKLSFADEWEEEEEEDDEDDTKDLPAAATEEAMPVDQQPVSNDDDDDVDSNDSTTVRELTAAELDRMVAASRKKRLGKNPGKTEPLFARTLHCLFRCRHEFPAGQRPRGRRADPARETASGMGGETAEAEERRGRSGLQLLGRFGASTIASAQETLDHSHVSHQSLGSAS